MTEIQAWVLAMIQKSPCGMGSGQLISAAAGKWYRLGHQTHWRRIDRAIQSLRKAGLIEYNGRMWRAK
jgi:hypothetical protein